MGKLLDSALAVFLSVHVNTSCYEKNSCLADYARVMRQTVYRSFSYYSNFDMCKRFLAFTSIRLIQYVYMPYLSRQQIGF